MYKMIFAALAVAAPMSVSILPASAAVTPPQVWSELRSAMPSDRPAIINLGGNDVGAAIGNAEPGGYLAVLTQAQTNRLERACDAGRGYSAPTVEFCHFLKDEIESTEREDGSN